MSKRRLVVVGNGMVGQRFLEAFSARDTAATWSVTVLGEEPRPAYDRVALGSMLAGATLADLTLADEQFYQDAGIALQCGERVVSIDRAARAVHTEAGHRIEWDALVLATGSTPFVPPLAGREATGVFVYRAVEDVWAIGAAAATASAGVVIGGGLLGLEAAGALRALGVQTTVVERAPRLMALQVDDPGGSVLRTRIERLGVEVITDAQVDHVQADARGGVSGVVLAGGRVLPAGIVVIAAGVRPRDDLARQCGLGLGERGGIVIDDECRTDDPAIWAVGECASHRGRVYGLVAPGYAMAEVVADHLATDQNLEPTSRFTGADMSTKLKLLGVDVASFGDAFATTPGAREVRVEDPIAGIYKKLVVGDGDDGPVVLGGVLVGDASSYAALRQLALTHAAAPATPMELLVGVGQPAALGVGNLDDAAVVCTCNNVSKEQICTAVREEGLREVSAVKRCTKAGTGCGSCVPMVTDLLNQELTSAGVAVRRGICEHFDHTRQELFEIVQVTGIDTFSRLLAEHGQGRGCEVCRPTVASIFASLDRGHVLDGEQAGLQDTNDRALANLQRDGTYSVVPRVPGGEITPERLIVLGQVAREFGLYVKITGAQRVDLFGARMEELPPIWDRLVEAGFESGHAYGKALRTVKSCVGQAWCRFGVQDSTSLAIELELRYRGLRSPHKLKSGVSGCARECAEARGKDFGIIATEAGWNLYVCGNGGMQPQHAELLAKDLDHDTLIRTIDRFLMFYIRTANRLERTAPWLRRLEGRIEHLRAVVLDDSLGIAKELEEAMARHVDSYACEWREVIEDPERRRHFTTFVNAPDRADPQIVMVPERDQHRPATPAERAALQRDAVAVAPGGQVLLEIPPVPARRPQETAGSTR